MTRELFLAGLQFWAIMVTGLVAYVYTSPRAASRLGGWLLRHSRGTEFFYEALSEGRRQYREAMRRSDAIGEAEEIVGVRVKMEYKG